MLKKLGYQLDKSQVIIKQDSITGLCEFPEPGDTQKHLLPIFVDPDSESGDARKDNSTPVSASDQDSGAKEKEFWMPDKYCKVCYACEEAFTMYRRRHHCRMCGQVFCNNCSNNYIDGTLINLQGPVRSCKLCSEQINERAQDAKNLKMKVDTNSAAVDNGRQAFIDTPLPFKLGAIQELPSEKFAHLSNLHARASEHMKTIVEHLINLSPFIEGKTTWRDIACNLIREVVSSVDPNVRNGDNLDIRHYVKLKIIPGGNLDENVCIDGVVFRKNVSHKKMLVNSSKSNPRMLLLAGGIDFQRTDNKLSSMDTLIEQEDKYMEILVDKIMSLKPDIILVGKAVARKAQELLCNHNVVVMQNVKPQLLERISRLIGAIMLPSTDHLIQQYGVECLGSCEKFWLRLVHDDPEKPEHLKSSPFGKTERQRIVRPQISKGSTYAYLQGCPSERGCTVVLRGDTREVLSEVKRILNFGIMLAYHLRLEVAYYNDRSAQLPSQLDPNTYEDDSDEDDCVQGFGLEQLRSLSTSNGHDVSATAAMGAPQDEGTVTAYRQVRQILSSSLDVDISSPYQIEVRGNNPPQPRAKMSPEDHQTLFFTALLMGEDSVHRSKVDFKYIKFYTNNQDIVLGQFLTENCFHFHEVKFDSSLLDTTMSFAHRKGRLEVKVGRVYDQNHLSDETTIGARDHRKFPILMKSFCKECNKVVTPEVVMSDETWKMSYGKFMEMYFYNRSARGRTGGCTHCMRDSHSLYFTCEGYQAKFDFIPMHPFALHIRKHMGFPTDYHVRQIIEQLTNMPKDFVILSSEFRKVKSQLEERAQEILTNPKELEMVLTNLQYLDDEVKMSTHALIEEIATIVNLFPNIAKEANAKRFSSSMVALDDVNVETMASASTMGTSPETSSPADTHVRPSEKAGGGDAAESDVGDLHAGAGAGAEVDVSVIVAPASDRPRDSDSSNVAVASMLVTPTRQVAVVEASAVGSGSLERSAVTVADDIEFKFPMYFKREAYFKAKSWNVRIQDLSTFVDQRKAEQMQQMQAAAAAAAASPQVALPFATRRDSDADQMDHFDDEFSREKRDGRPKSVMFQHSRQDLSIIADIASSVDGLSSSPTKPSDVADEEASVAGDRPSLSSVAATDRPSTMLSLAESERKRPGTSVDFTQSPRSERAERAEATGLTDVDPKSSRANNRQGLKVLTRLIMGKDTDVDSRLKDVVPLGNVGMGRLRLKPGRKGEVIPVVEEELGTIIAYSLASDDYYFELQRFFVDDVVDDGETDVVGLPTSEEISAQTHKRPKSMGFHLKSSLKQSDWLPTVTTGSTAKKAEPENSSSKVNGGPQGASGQPEDVNTDFDAFSSFHMNNDHDAAELRGLEKMASMNFPHSTTPAGTKDKDLMLDREKQLKSGRKLHVTHKFNDINERGNVYCKFECTSFWAGQFEALRATYLKDVDNEGFIRSLSMSNSWSAQGGKSGASFAKSLDDRFIVKEITSIELHMFVDFAPAYFDHMAKAIFTNMPTVLGKVLGAYQIIVSNKETDRKWTKYMIVMENMFYERNITRCFDLKGSSRKREAEVVGKLDTFDEALLKRRKARRNKSALSPGQSSSQVLLDDNLIKLTSGRPFPLKHKAKMYFHKAVYNDTKFLSAVKVVDYSILVGFDENKFEVVVGIIDFLRQYDIAKKVENMGKSVAMFAGNAEPTIIQPEQYKHRFTLAMEKYFMTVPDKWIFHDS